MGQIHQLIMDHGIDEARERTVDKLERKCVDAAYAVLSDEDFRTSIDMFGTKTTVGAFITNLVLCGHAAYRTQLFCYLKACGREELSTMNLWAGIDAPAS